MNNSIYGIYNVMTTRNKTVNLNIRVTEEVRAGFKAVARLNGRKVSEMLNEFMVGWIRKEEERNLRKFEEKLLLVREEEEQELNSKASNQKVSNKNIVKPKEFLIEGNVEDLLKDKTKS